MVTSLVTPRRLYAKVSSTASSTVSGFGQTGNPYEELGVTTVIHCEGTMTMLGGSVLRPELEAVTAMAGRHFASIPELEVAAGKRITEMLNLPDGYSALVTSGAAAAMHPGWRGILTGDNEALIRQLPDLTGMKSEVIIQKSHRNPFDHQLRSTGVKLIEIETRVELRLVLFHELLDVVGSVEGKPGLSMCSFMLQPGEDKIVAERLVHILKEHSA